MLRKSYIPVLSGINIKRTKPSKIIENKTNTPTCKDNEKCAVLCVAFKDRKRNPELKDDGRCENDRHTYQNKINKKTCRQSSCIKSSEYCPLEE